MTSLACTTFKAYSMPVGLFLTPFVPAWKTLYASKTLRDGPFRHKFHGPCISPFRGGPNEGEDLSLEAEVVGSFERLPGDIFYTERGCKGTKLPFYFAGEGTRMFGCFNAAAVARSIYGRTTNFVETSA